MRIHQLRERRFRIAQISKRFKISRKTVYKYLEMSFEEAISIFSHAV
ncbi:helix-turn-helix domain-containing protein [Lysinibacillus sp. NPDC093197]